MANQYESDITQLIKQHKQEHPDTELRQREGRGRLWDKSLDFELHDGYKQARVPQKPYVYQTD